MKKVFAWALLPLMVAVSCDKGEDGDWFGHDKSSEYGGYGPEEAVAPSVDYGDFGGGGNGGGGEAGVLTAAEWNDLANWNFWRKLEQGQDYSGEMSVWKFDTSSRVAVRVVDGNGAPVVNQPVELYQGQSLLWAAKTDNKGEANCWFGLYPKDIEPAENLQIHIGGVAQNGAPVLSTGMEDDTPVWNEYTVSAAAPEAKADIAFIVDATGSMGDEINFLQKDLLSILESVKQSQAGVEISTGAVFYRDKGDQYVTKYNQFTTDISATMNYIKDQSAGGGGDLPEAVHTALECTLQNLAWNPQARSRIAFLILDAPAHSDQSNVIESLHLSIEAFARYGIRIIPVLASTGDKSAEFMCRYFAIVTGGTYVFLTDDSGVGESHLEPTVGQYQVEKLNDLLVRLITEYIS